MKRREITKNKTTPEQSGLSQREGAKSDWKQPRQDGGLRSNGWPIKILPAVEQTQIDPVSPKWEANHIAVPRDI